MTESEWLNANAPRTMLAFLEGKASDRKLRLFGVAFCSCQKSQITHKQTLVALDLAERLADDLDNKKLRQGLATVCKHVFWFSASSQHDNNARGQAGAVNYAAQAGVVDDNYFAYVDTALMFYLNTATPKTVAAICELARCVFGNPFRAVVIDPNCRTTNVLTLAEGIYNERAFDRLPILADCLMDAGCEDEAILSHCRSDGPHVRGCWVIDALLGKE